MTPPQETEFRLADMAPPRRNRAALVAVAVAAVVALMAATGIGVWYFIRPGAGTPGGGASAEAGTIDAGGSVVLEFRQFIYESRDPGLPCSGQSGFADIRIGTQVAVTDAAGKVLGIGTLDQGTASGHHAMPDGSDTAAWCTLPFKVAGVPRGVGPYGVEVAHRGVVRYDEGHLGIVRMGF